MAPLNPLFQKIILKSLEIDASLTKLAVQINKFYCGYESVLGLGILRGCLPFMSDLTKKLSFPLQIEYLQVSSYYQDKKTNVFNYQLLFDPAILAQRDVLIFEDIVDTGETLNKVCKQLESYHPKSLRTVTFYNRVQANPLFTPDFCAQQIKNG